VDRATENIEQEIDRGRELLRSNLEELEARVRSAVDWRRAYRDNTATALGIAFGSALLLGLMVRGPPNEPPVAEYQPAMDAGGRRSDARQREISLAWRAIESALIGVAASHLQNLLVRVVPGFHEQITRREGARRQDSAARCRS
jgi:hypothetical protein